MVCHRNDRWTVERAGDATPIAGVDAKLDFSSALRKLLDYLAHNGWRIISMTSEEALAMVAVERPRT